MKTIQPYTRFIALVLAAFAIAGCANKMAPAQKAIADIEAAVAAAGEDATKYIPDEVQAVNDQVANLKAMFDKKDYKGVLAAAPAVLTQAQGLTSAAAAKKTEMMDAYAGEWSTLSSSVPEAVAAIQSRVDVLSKSKKLPDGDGRRYARQRQDRSRGGEHACGARRRRLRPPATWSRP